MTVYDPFSAVRLSSEPPVDSTTSSTTLPNTTIPKPSAQLSHLPIHAHFSPTQSHPSHHEHHRTLTQNLLKTSLDPSIRNDTKDFSRPPTIPQHADQAAEEHYAFADEKSCNSSTSISKPHQTHTENTPPYPQHHADTAAQIQGSLSTNNDAAVPISIKDALIVDEKTEKVATRDPRMSSAEVTKRFLTEEQLREVKWEEESKECEAGGADAGFEREVDSCSKEGERGRSLLASLPRGSNGMGVKGYGARCGGNVMGDIWTGGSKIGKSMSGTEE